LQRTLTYTLVTRQEETLRERLVLASYIISARSFSTEMQGNQYLNQLVTRSRILCIPVLVSVTSLPLCVLGGSDMSMSLQRDDPWSLSIVHLSVQNDGKA
ncbi:unnamed protein product, partial [Porites evermanni]